MVRKIISIVCYIIAGLFLCEVCMMGFIHPYLMKIVLMGGSAIPVVIALTIGLAIGGLQTWKQDIGIMLLSASGLTAFAVFTMFCSFSSSEFKEFFPDYKIDFFNDWITGLSCTTLFAFLGIFLIKKTKGK